MTPVAHPLVPLRAGGSSIRSEVDPGKTAMGGMSHLFTLGGFESSYSSLSYSIFNWQ